MFDVLNSSLRDFGQVFEGGSQVGVWTTKAKVEKEAHDAIMYNYRSFVISNPHIKLARELLANTGIRICSAFSYPFGGVPLEIKKYEMAKVIEYGCDSIDGVVNHSYLKMKENAAFQEELCELVEYGKSLKKDIEIKFIVDCGYVTDEELIVASKAIQAAKADFIKTGTAWGEASGANLHHIKLIRETVGPDMGIKAVSNLTTSACGVVALLNAGANIMGTDPTYAMEDFLPYQEKMRNGTL